MASVSSHSWDLSIGEAKLLQTQMARLVVTETTFDPSTVQTVAGVDVGLRAGVARAAVVVLSFPGLQPVDWARAEAPASFPYVPGLLAFREGPCVLAALDKLASQPDLLVFDGHGLAHPRRLGLATHLGVILDRPSIGCAKSRLIGESDALEETVGSCAPLRHEGEVIGAVVRSRARVKPLYVSIGHRIDLSTAIDFVLRCTRGYRLPETTRYAHRVAGGLELTVDPVVAS